MLTSISAAHWTASTAVMTAYRSTGKRTKAANIRFAQCREWIEGGRAVLRRISGHDNPADMLSKAVTPAVHRRHRVVTLGADPDGVATLVDRWGPTDVVVDHSPVRPVPSPAFLGHSARGV